MMGYSTYCSDECIREVGHDGDHEYRANAHHCCSGCDANGHCTHGYEPIPDTAQEPTCGCGAHG